jgi:Tfp pilus assembly protein PilP
MKATTIALLWVVAAASVWAQTAPPPSQRMAPPAKTAAQPSPPKAGEAEAAMRRKLAPRRIIRRTPATPAAKPAGEAVKQAAIKTTAAAKPAARRDPFVSPIREQGPIGSGCSTGKKCLAIDAIVLRGIVKSQAGMIAVVESSTRRISYFLRENDPVFNGYVVRITPDTVVFRENVMDRLGKQSTRDVVMKVVAPVV